MNTRDVGARIRRLRLLAGFGQTEFAERLGTSGGTISKIENGQVIVDQMLPSIARELGCTPRFLTDTCVVSPAGRPLLRAYADASQRVVDRQIADATTAVEAIKMLDLRLLPDLLPTFESDPSSDYEIERYATDVRSAAGLSETDVCGNVIRAAERLGCVVLPMSSELGRRHLGLSTKVDGIPLICVSAGSATTSSHIPGDRQRFTVAHELGHHVLHSHVAPPSTTAESAALERQAHLFAGAFLAPGEAMMEELHRRGGRVTLRTLEGIKADWGISIKALVMRFQALGVVDADQSRSLHKQISARGWNKNEPVKVGNERAVWFSKALKQWSRGDGRRPLVAASESLGLGIEHLYRWTVWSTEAPDIATKRTTGITETDGVPEPPSNVIPLDRFRS